MKKIDVIMALAALAQETRLDIFRLLVKEGPDGAPAGRIGESLGLPSPTLSFHLSQLKHAGLVDCRRQGRSLIYSANFTAMNAMVGYLTENCCGIGLEACAVAVSESAAEPELAAQDME